MRARFSALMNFSRFAAAGVLCLALAACSGGGSKPAATRPAESFPTDAPAARAGQGVQEQQGAWSIVIAAGADEAAEAASRELLAKVQREGGLPEAYAERRGKAVVIAYGRYSGPDDPRAQRDLARIRDITVDGEKPFIGAVLVPPPFEALPGSIPEYDLNNVKRTRGKDALYTLQVAIYTRLDTNNPKPQELAEFRKAAEKAVIELRREGEEAFYYHGPRGSTVTVGVFGPEDHDPTKPGSDSFVLREARRRHPLNLVNGAPLLTRTRGQTQAKPQPSFLVPIP
jgi:hypothetical protein